MNTITMIEVNAITSHALDTRSQFYDDDIIAMRCRDIEAYGGLDPAYPLIVRATGIDEFQVIDGGARLQAARFQELQMVPCIVKSMSYDDAVISCLKINTCHGVSNLIKGIAALKLGLEVGGRGHESKRGAFCREFNIDPGNQSKFCNSAVVFLHIASSISVDDRKKLEKKASYLYKVKDAPTFLWVMLGEWIANNTAYDRIDKVIAFIEDYRSLDNYDVIESILPLKRLVAMNLKNETGSLTVLPVARKIAETIHTIQQQGRDEDVQQFLNIVEETAFEDVGGRSFFRFRDVHSICGQTVGNDVGKDIIYHGDAIAFVESLANYSVDAIVMDASYGNGYHNIGTGGPALHNDTHRDAIRIHKSMAKLTYAKLKDNCFCVVWYATSMLSEILPLFIEVGYHLESQFHWIKNNHSQSLPSQPLNQTESAFIFSKGNNPIWLARTPNYFNCDVPQSRLHPCEKPIELCETLMNAISTRNSVILEPFMGSGNFSAVSKRNGRVVLASEIDDNYYEVGYSNIMFG